MCKYYISMPSKKSTRSKRTSSKNKNQGSTRKRKNSTKKSTPKSKSSKVDKQTRIEQIENMWNNIFSPNSEQVEKIQETGPIANATNNNKKAVVVLIHADWCGHCQRLEPEWNSMKSALDNNVKQHVIFEEIESADLDTKLPIVSKTYLGGKTLEYRGFPTIGSIRNGKFEMYGGGRTAPELLDWVRGLVA
jgi:thiol-disulfide isomerase/thioredoxin